MVAFFSAFARASELGIVETKDQCIMGEEIDKLSEEELKEYLAKHSDEDLRADMDGGVASDDIDVVAVAEEIQMPAPKKTILVEKK